MRLQLAVARTGDVAVVRCRGVIVFGPEEDELRLIVLSLLKETNHVVLLLEGVERIDSQGVATLVGLYISARNRGGANQARAIVTSAQGSPAHYATRKPYRNLRH